MRTIRRLPGGPVVAVRVRERPFAEVVADMIEGIVVANVLDAATALRVRAMLMRALPAGDAHTVTQTPARVA